MTNMECAVFSAQYSLFFVNVSGKIVLTTLLYTTVCYCGALDCVHLNEKFSPYFG